MLITKDFFVGIEAEMELSYKDVDKKDYKYHPEFDSLMSVFSDISKSLYQRGLNFILQINNERYLTFDIELCIFLEEFYNLSSFTFDKKTKVYELWFYEQGLNYRFAFKKIDTDSYTLSFTDDNTPELAPIIIVGSILNLQLILVTFYQRITFLTARLCPTIARDDMYMEWQSSIKSLFKI